MAVTAVRSWLAMISAAFGWLFAADDAAASESTDFWITSRVKVALIDAEDVDGFAIDVVTTDGVVTLAGVVGDEGSRDRAAAVAWSVEGVVGVRNHVRVVAGVAARAPAPRGEWAQAAGRD